LAESGELFMDDSWSEGDALYKLGLKDEAIKAYDRVIELNPEDFVAWVGKGVALCDLGRKDEAIKAYDRVIELDPKNSESWRKKGLILYRIGGGLDEEAIKAFDQAIKLDPNNSRAWYGKGYPLYILGRKDEAIKAYDRAIELDPKNPESWNSKGKILENLGREAEAIEAFNHAIELKSKNSKKTDSIENQDNTKSKKSFHNLPEEKKKESRGDFAPHAGAKKIINNNLKNISNAKIYFIIILVGAVICSIIALYATRNLEISAFIFFMVFVILIFAQISSTCSNCGNVNGINLDCEKLVDTKQYQKYFTRSEPIVKSVRRDHDGKVIDSITHYNTVDYVKTTTISTYENTYVCEYCGATSRKQYQTHSSKINRL
jgi:Flp pilus assembly protein TadD